jgi:hypothetical protein
MRNFNENMITKVVTVSGAYLFNTLQDAQIHFPDLAIGVNGKNFTSAMHDIHEGVDIMRFEDWKTYQSMSLD